MKQITNTHRSIQALAVAAAVVLVTATFGVAGRNPNPGVLPIDSTPHGKSYGEWGAAWWQWALSVPEASNPVGDTTGEFAGEGQSGPVWFLAGTWGFDAERSCTVPAGKSLFFPVVNVVAGPFGPCPPEGCDVEAYRQEATDFIDAVDILEAEVDGVPLEDLFAYRAASPTAFDLTFPEGAMFGLPEGSYGPHVSDGYWLMLTPLPPGEHTIRFRGGISGEGGFAVEVIYHLTVK